MQENHSVTHSGSTQKLYRCGTLTYTSIGLMMLFVWLLWGDFVYVIMEDVLPNLMPLKFQALGASNLEMALVGSTIPTIVYSVMNPVISFKSDRFRSRWGRRIPLIAVTILPIVICLVGVAYSEPIGGWLHGKLDLMHYHLSSKSVILITIGGMLACFSFFNTFVNTVFWYLFNDVVPEHLLARFMSWFRLVSQLSNSAFCFWILPWADPRSPMFDTYMKWIFLGGAILYLVGFGSMCIFVKEGEYPPPPENIDGKEGSFSATKSYLVECLTVKHYWYQWANVFIGSIGGGVNAFGTLFQLAIGLSMAQIGFIRGCTGLEVAVLVLGTGWLADKYHPIRVVLAGGCFGLMIATPLSIYCWTYWHPTGKMAYWVALVLAFGIQAPGAAMGAMADPPLLMRMFPRERYGQFCSTNAVFRAMGGVVGSLIAGEALDYIGKFVGADNAYFYIPVWQFVFGIPSLLLFFGYFLSWKRLGGDDDYVPPLPPASNVDATRMVEHPVHS